MDFRMMKSVIEALLFVAGDEGLEIRQLAEVLQVREEVAEQAIRDLKHEMGVQGRGLTIVKLAGAYQLVTSPDVAPYIERFAALPMRGTLSQAALETLSIIAYKQPITRIEIEEIRGVKSDRAIHTLISKDLIMEVGRADAVGRPILYGTTKQFLDYFGLSSLNDLPEPVSLDARGMLDEETRLLFEKLEAKQLTIDDVPPQPDAAKDGA